ncbi:2-hydroxyacid dehydrogenase [Ruegeria atlantica]|uniref:2-hydroxyacid dehydrogenase n=1 Tax=Ruegeria atlantica TaxID=81569 RepID=UPI00148053D2|nr:glyoxylate/hydroxypyruvate reductase A [Ruegeria atlantica]
MAILFNAKVSSIEAWQSALSEALPGQEFRLFPDVGAKHEIEYALVWDHPKGDLATYPNLRAIFLIGAGADHLLADKTLPDGIPIVRLVDDVSVRDMTHYTVFWVLFHHRQFGTFMDNQRNAEWTRVVAPPPNQRRIGFLGLGHMGSHAAMVLSEMGFDVSGWSRSQKDLAGINCYTGDGGFVRVLGSSDILINMLPLTPETNGVLNANAFALLPRSAFLINLGRGAAIHQASLLEALDSGQLAGAALDVFEVEPLPKSHPFWSHPKIYVTPHIGGPTQEESAIKTVVANIKAVELGNMPGPIWQPDSGY